MHHLDRLREDYSTNRNQWTRKGFKPRTVKTSSFGPIPGVVDTGRWRRRPLFSVRSRHRRYLGGHDSWHRRRLEQTGVVWVFRGRRVLRQTSQVRCIGSWYLLKCRIPHLNLVTLCLCGFSTASLTSKKGDSVTLCDQGKVKRSLYRVLVI